MPDIAETRTADAARPAKRIVTAPGGTGPMGAGEVLWVELGPDEDVEWSWSHDRERGSFVTGYRITVRAGEHR